MEIIIHIHLKIFQWRLFRWLHILLCEFLTLGKWGRGWKLLIYLSKNVPTYATWGKKGRIFVFMKVAFQLVGISVGEMRRTVLRTEGQIRVKHWNIKAQCVNWGQGNLGWLKHFSPTQGLENYWKWSTNIYIVGTVCGQNKYQTYLCCM